MRQQRAVSSEWLLLGQTKVVQQHKHLCAPFVELNTAKPGGGQVIAIKQFSNSSFEKEKNFFVNLEF